MRPVELVESGADGGIQEGQLGVDCKLNQWNRGRLDKLDFSDPVLGQEELLQLLEGSPNALVFRQEIHEGKD